MYAGVLQSSALLKNIEVQQFALTLGKIVYFHLQLYKHISNYWDPAELLFTIKLECAKTFEKP